MPNVNNGQSIMGKGWSYVQLKKSIISNSSLHSTSHELGHALGLGHTFNSKEHPIKNGLNKATTINIMDYESQYTEHRRLFYKRQINYIYNNHVEIK